MKKSKNIFILLFIFIIVATPNISKALPPGMSSSPDIFIDSGGGSLVDEPIEDESSTDPMKHPSAYKPDGISSSDTGKITSKVNKIIGSITTIGVIIAMITIIILGIKYMVGSVEQKAEYKKSMIPYLIGSVFLFSTSVVVKIISTLVENIGI